MEEVGLGRTGLRVSRVGLGTAPLASIFWGNDEPTATDTARRALHAGLTFFDTAPFYGLGECERRLGAALRGGRDGVVIATKVGRTLQTGSGGEVEARFDFSYDAVRRSLDGSLGRLGIDRVIVVHIHDPDDHIDEAVAGAHRALVDLRDQGVIDAVSLGTNSVQTAATILERCDLDCLLVAGRFTLLDQSGADELLPLCEKLGVAVLAAGVFQGGVLADTAAGAPHGYARVPPTLLRQIDGLRELCRAYDVPLLAAALQFPLTHPAVSAVVVGARSPREITEAAAWLDHEIPKPFWAALGRV